jgi:translation initiation factor 2B subunit (eIF-2B alpha/beta/delta family)
MNILEYLICSMLELVFGPESTFVPPKDPVDYKLHRLINHTLKKAALNSTASAAATEVASAMSNTMDTTDTKHSKNLIDGIVVQTNNLLDDVSLATTNGGYTSTVSSDSGIRSVHSHQTDTRTKRKNIRFLFQRSNSLPENLVDNASSVPAIGTVTEEMDITEYE